jgi:hypothetical protein
MESSRRGSELCRRRFSSSWLSTPARTLKLPDWKLDSTSITRFTTAERLSLPKEKHWMKIRQSEKMKGFTRKERETVDENQTIRKKILRTKESGCHSHHRNLVPLAFLFRERVTLVGYYF